MAIDNELNDKLMKAVRVKSGVAEGEISDLVQSCIKDLEIAGVYVKDVNEPLCKQAIKLYCKANYGYDKDTEKFEMAYKALKDSMALSGDYPKEGDSYE